MNEHNSEPKYEVVPPPLPEESNKNTVLKTRLAILHLCGHSVLSAYYFHYLWNQLQEFNSRFHGFIDADDQMRMFLLKNSPWIVTLTSLYIFSVIQVVRALRNHPTEKE